MIPWSLQTHECVTSTQDLVKTAAASGANEGVVIQALQQTGGKGRHGREWVSEEGNLYLSLLLHPKFGIRYVGQIALLTGVALAHTVCEHLDQPKDLRLKWPNDILIKGKKCAGILLETSLKDNTSIEWMVVGVGVNISSAPKDAAYLCQYGHDRFKVDKVRDRFLQNFAALYERWNKHGFEMVRDEWLDLAHPIGDPVQVRLGEAVRTGVFSGIDELGNMLLKDRGEIHTITAGDVYI